MLTAVFGSPDFFQRSGSVLTAAAAWSFVLIGKATGSVTPTDISGDPECFGQLRADVGKKVSGMSKVSGALTVVGTAIWGYGDVVMKVI